MKRPNCGPGSKECKGQCIPKSWTCRDESAEGFLHNGTSSPKMNKKVNELIDNDIPRYIDKGFGAVVYKSKLPQTTKNRYYSSAEGNLPDSVKNKDEKAIEKDKKTFLQKHGKTMAMVLTAGSMIGLAAVLASKNQNKVTLDSSRGGKVASSHENQILDAIISSSATPEEAKQIHRILEEEGTFNYTTRVRPEELREEVSSTVRKIHPKILTESATQSEEEKYDLFTGRPKGGKPNLGGYPGSMLQNLGGHSYGGEPKKAMDTMFVYTQNDGTDSIYNQPMTPSERSDLVQASIEEGDRNNVDRRLDLEDAERISSREKEKFLTTKLPAINEINSSNELLDRMSPQYAAAKKEIDYYGSNVESVLPKHGIEATREEFNKQAYLDLNNPDTLTKEEATLQHKVFHRVDMLLDEYRDTPKYPFKNPKNSNARALGIQRGVKSLIGDSEYNNLFPKNKKMTPGRLILELNNHMAEIDDGIIPVEIPDKIYSNYIRSKEDILSVNMSRAMEFSNKRFPLFHALYNSLQSFEDSEDFDDKESILAQAVERVQNKDFSEFKDFVTLYFEDAMLQEQISPEIIAQIRRL